MRIKNLEVLCQRSISAGMHGGDAFATASLAKSVWGEIGKDLAALAFDTLTRCRRRTMGRIPFDITRADDRRRHHPDQQEHHGPTSARTPPPMNLEPTDEQQALRDTVRRFLAEKAADRRPRATHADRCDGHN